MEETMLPVHFQDARDGDDDDSEEKEQPPRSAVLWTEQRKNVLDSVKLNLATLEKSWSNFILGSVFALLIILACSGWFIVYCAPLSAYMHGATIDQVIYTVDLTTRNCILLGAGFLVSAISLMSAISVFLALADAKRHEMMASASYLMQLYKEEDMAVAVVEKALQKQE